MIYADDTDLYPSSGKTLVDGQNYLITVVYDYNADTFTFYVNNDAPVVVNLTKKLKVSAGSIGFLDWGLFYGGLWDETQVSAVVRSVAWVSASYLAQIDSLNNYQPMIYTHAQSTTISGKRLSYRKKTPKTPEQKFLEQNREILEIYRDYLTAKHARLNKVRGKIDDISN